MDDKMSGPGLYPLPFFIFFTSFTLLGDLTKCHDFICHPYTNDSKMYGSNLIQLHPPLNYSVKATTDIHTTKPRNYSQASNQFSLSATFLLLQKENQTLKLSLQNFSIALTHRQPQIYFLSLQIY